MSKSSRKHQDKMMFKFVTISLVFTLVAAIEPGCENCGCCVGKICAPKQHQGYTINDFCTNGCIPGIGGNKCYNKCPDDCVTCEQTINKNCATCEAGKYVHTYGIENKRCVDCPIGCKSCISSTNCQECKASYYNSGSTGSCSSTCTDRCKSCTSRTRCQECNPPYYNDDDVTDCSLSCPGNCFCSTPGECSSCQDGYYNIQSQCPDKCPDKCKTCSDRDTCQSCMDGYYNGKEYDNANNVAVTDCSLSCRGNCIKCDSYNQCAQCKYGFALPTCTECTTGWYGELCDKACPTACKDNKCKRGTGHCYECNSMNITGNTCDQCVAGTWGNTCSSVCPARCQGGRCIRDTGFCESCAGNFVGNRCDKCVDGYHGVECDKECPENCQESYCNKTTGFCNSCKSNFVGLTCNKCKGGLYGENCGKLCPSKGCADNTCDRDTGNCLSCPHGFYGSLCDKNCSQGCNNGSCVFSTGLCFGCLTPFTGDKCCIQDGHCLTCSSNSECQICANDYYGEKCNQTCPENCLVDGQESVCERNNGTCKICSNGFFGDFCNKICDKRCANNLCFQNNGHCADGCADDNFEEPTCTQEKTSGPDITIPAAAGGAAAAIIIIVIVIVVIFVIRRRRSDGDRHAVIKDEQNIPQLPGTPSSKDDSKTYYSSVKFKPAVLEEDVEAEDEDDTLPRATGGQDVVYENVASITVSGFDAYVRKKAKEDYKQEFEQLPKGITQSCKDARKEENVVKNRYKGVYPYDHTRVKIKGDPKFFINACNIDGFRGSPGYIASLGPTEVATEDFNTFWTMVWHVNSDVIVMLTNLREPSGNKCDQYWPSLNCTNTHQDITVSCRSIEVFAEYTVRTFAIKKKSKERTVYQFHYTAWPDKSIPDEVTSLVEFRQRVRNAPRDLSGPVIVHCSAGIGRTGTYIALDRLTEAGEAGERINVYECVNQMRQQRVNMVQTLEQYEFLHKALVHTLTFKSEAIPVEKFVEYIRKTSDAEFNKHFQLLDTVVDEVSSEELQARRTNGSLREKNRKKSDIPGDRNRPRLHICRKLSSSDYINAMFFDGFKKKNQYIIAQSPLPETVFDFICLIYQENCYCVVSMEDPDLIGTEIGDYMGTDNQTLKCGSFTVKPTRGDSTPHYVLRKLIISNNEKRSSGEKIVYHYQLNNWKSTDDVPADVRQFTQSVKDVSNKAGEMMNEQAPILVHCLNGAKRSGLFCAVGVLLEKIEAEGQASVPNTLRRLRTRRKLSIPDKKQFEFCYRSIEAYSELNNTYSNFGHC